MPDEPIYDKIGLTQWYWRALNPAGLKIGKNVQIGSFTVIDATRGVVIEDCVLIGFGCAILSYSSIDAKGGKVTLRRGCRIGSHSVIMPGVTIGEDAIIGANSFVNKDIPPKEVWAGSPARYLRSLRKLPSYRDKETLETTILP